MIISKKKPMNYGGQTEVLYYEVFDDGYGILVKNICGSHPCGYVKIPDEIISKIKEDNPSYLVGEDNIWIDAEIHGGITFCGYMEGFDDEFFIGWDYAHAGDYCWWCPGLAHHKNYNERHWTTDEIIDHARLVIKALREGRYEV